MTFTMRIKEEMAKIDANSVEAISELSAFLRFNGKLNNKTITMVIENDAVAKRIYKFLKGIYGVTVNITIRNQRRFRTRQIYILSIKERYNFILESLNIEDNGKKIMPKTYLLDTEEEKYAFVRGMFLACGSINDPKNGTYHMEFITKSKREANYIQKLLNEFEFRADSKILKRTNHFMIYIKSAEAIGEFIKIFGAVNSLFYYEDIRIYRDHKNMVNRLNNCEIANQEKIISTGLKHLKTINYLEENDLTNLLDEKVKTVLKYRKMYPETSYDELANIISMETKLKMSKSKVNHAFIKMNDLLKRHTHEDLL